MNTLRGVICAAWVAACLCVPISTHALEAGAAKVELVPAEGVPLDGDFSRRGRPAFASRDSLHIRALYLQDDNAACFIVAADLFAISAELRARVLELAPAGISPENVVLVATHTLNGPGGMDRSWLGRQRGGRFMPEHVEAVAAKFAEAMQLAYDGRKRAAAGYAGADSGLVVNRFDPLAEVDGRLTVLRVDDSDGNPIAIVANLGMAAQGAPAMAFSADFPGAFCSALEAMTAVPSVAFFLNGASADQIAAPVDAGQAMADALAARVKGMANEISCREVALAFSSATVETPRHSAQPFYPAEAVVQALEVDRLALLFMPAIPRGAVSNALRKSISAQGYAHSMVAAPANGYLGAIAPATSIGLAEAAGEPVYFGPGAAEWLVARAPALLSRAEVPNPADPMVSESAYREANGIVRLALAGAPEDIGAERGRVLRTLGPAGGAEAHPAEWIRRAASPVLEHWRLLNPVVSVETVALPIAGEAVRGLLRGVGADTVAVLAGMSESAGVPFAHLWLRQLAPSSSEGVPAGPVGVAFFLETDDLGTVIGHSIEWPAETPLVVAQVRPKQGRAHVIAGLPWQMGGVAGVNDRGLAAAAAPARHVLHSGVTTPAEAMLSEVLSAASTLDDAIALLSVARTEFTGRVLLAHDDGAASQTAVVELGVLPSVTIDLTTGVIPADDAAPMPREARVARLLEGLGDATAADAETVLIDRDRRVPEGDRILLPVTRGSLVLVPRRHEIRVMAPDGGAARAFEAVAVRGDES